MAAGPVVLAADLDNFKKGVSMKNLVLGIALLFSSYCLAGYELVNLSKTVTTAGTRVRVSATDLVYRACVVQVKRGNTGLIYIGGPTVSSTAGHELIAPAANTPLAQFSLSGVEHGGGNAPQDIKVNLKDVWIDSSVNGEGVNLTCVK